MGSFEYTRDVFCLRILEVISMCQGFDLKLYLRGIRRLEQWAVQHSFTQTER